MRGQSYANEDNASIPWWLTVICASLAGGMGWGIRGQYGHETGAMIAGVLVCLVIVLTLCRNANLMAVARAVALGTIAMGFGGTETYGQTVGLTHDPEMVGNWSALYWGMFGLAIKGSVWIGFCGLFLGMGLGGKRYTALEMLVVMLGSLLAYKAGVWLFNSPYDLETKRLPALYFSATWALFPNKPDLEPRFEAWGGIWLALIFFMAYAGVARKDGLAWRLGLWGVLGGALGFPGGQCIQAYHAWNVESFAGEFWKTLNYWNFMETTFGLIMGAILGLGAWLHRSRIRLIEYDRDDWMTIPWEIVLVVVHCALLILSDVYIPYPFIQDAFDLGLIMGVMPMMAIAGGRLWPLLTIFPVTLLPIASKTISELVYSGHHVSPGLGWLAYMLIPMAIALFAVARYEIKAEEGLSANVFTSTALLICAWTYFLLNFAIFQFPWPWQTWTGRTPNAVVFALCLAGLTWLALAARRNSWFARSASPSP